jgi:hypothetical protein
MLPHMRIPASSPTNIVLVFVSSGDDLARLRNMVWRFAIESINPVLREMKLPVRLEIDRWEHTAPHRAPDGQTLNSEFAARARAAQLVLCLLHEKLGDGTREEIEATLEQEGVELSVVWCVNRNDWPNTEVGQWLAPLKGQIFIDRAEAPNTDGPPTAIFRILLEAALTVARQIQPEGLLREQR